MHPATRPARLLTHAAWLLASGAVLVGCADHDRNFGIHEEKILVRRDRPTQEERDRAPPPPYEETLRAEQARKDGLVIPKDVHESTQFYDQTTRETKLAVGPPFGPAHDPWMSYEDDRRKVLVREWADTGKPEIPPPEPVKERVTEDDPYAPAPKVGKKEPAPDPADADKKPDEEKKPEGEKKGD